MLFCFSIEGIDGSGKETTTKAVKNFLNENCSYNVLMASCPDYESPIGQRIKSLLTDKSKNINKAHMDALFALDRKAIVNTMMEKYDNNDINVFLFDRYYHSNIFYQTLDMNDEKIDNYISKVEKMELSDFKIPKIDTIYYIDTPLDVCINRVKLRKNNNDKYEKIDYLTKVFNHSGKVIELIKSRNEELKVINTENKTPKDLGTEIGTDILNTIKRKVE